MASGVMRVFLVSTMWFCSITVWARTVPVDRVDAPPLQVSILQFDPIAGDFEYNFNIIAEGYLAAVAKGSDLFVTPETAVEGYTSGDLFRRPEFWVRSEQMVMRLRKLTEGKPTAMVLGHIDRNPMKFGKHYQNVASVFADGERVFRQAKMLLPSYDRFDDSRWFEAGRKNIPFVYKGYKVGIGICEDWWGADTFSGGDEPRVFYDPARQPVEQMKKAGVDLGISLSASPYARDKAAYRERIHADAARRLGVPVIWVGMTGATDSYLFDGRSFVLDAYGQTVERLAHFENDTGIVNFPEGLHGPDTVIKVVKKLATIDTNPSEEAVVYKAMVAGIREYFRRTGLKRAVLGISGGLDSSVSAKLLVDALGAENCIFVKMPSPYSRPDSISDADRLVELLHVPPENVFTRPLAASHAALKETFAEHWGGDGSLVDENTQAGLRSLILNRIANAIPAAMVVGTTNKTEAALGYFTFGGDDKSGLASLVGLWKTEVFHLARWINRHFGETIPENVLAKPPSADLKPGQTTEKALGDFGLLDPMLKDYYENQMALEEVEAKYDHWGEAGWVRKLVRLFHISHFKRRQFGVTLMVDAKRNMSWEEWREPIAAVKMYPLASCEALMQRASLTRSDLPLANARQWFTGTLKPTRQSLE